MSDFNEANELASQLVDGLYYQSKEPCPKIDKIVFVKPGNTRGITVKKNDDWVGTANEIEDLLRQGYYPKFVFAKIERCKIHNDNRGITFGSDAVHHACGCVVLRGEDVMNENDVELALGQIAIAEGSAIPCSKCGDALADNYDCDTCQDNMEEEVQKQDNENGNINCRYSSCAEWIIGPDFVLPALRRIRRAHCRPAD